MLPPYRPDHAMQKWWTFRRSCFALYARTVVGVMWISSLPTILALIFPSVNYSFSIGYTNCIIDLFSKFINIILVVIVVNDSCYF